MSFKEGVDYFNGSLAAELMMRVVEPTEDDMAAARRYMIRHNAEDLLEMMGL